MTAANEPGRLAVRRVLGWVLVVSLCVAALTAIVAITSGDFDDTDWRVIAASLGFGIFSALGASGMSLRFRTSEGLRMLGLVTIGLAALSYVLLLAGLLDEESEEVWRWFGSIALASFAASHASLVAGARRDTDSAAVEAIGIASILLSTIDSGIGILAIAEAFDDPDPAFVQFLAVLVILLLLTTALPPILRRLQRRPEAPAPAAASPLAAEVLVAVDRIEALNAEPGNHAPQIRRECERLRELARTYDR